MIVMLYRKFVPLIILILALAGCGETRTGIMDSFIFDEEGDWLIRDTVEDPNELVNGYCCNDTIPLPLAAIDTTIRGVINPVEDLDYYDLQVSGSYAGQLFLAPADDNLTIRLFSREMEEYATRLDTLPPSSTNGYQRTLWTTLYGPDIRFTLLVKSDHQDETGEYAFQWLRVEPTFLLRVEQPDSTTSWNRSGHLIEWSQSGVDGVSVALLRGPAMIEILAKNIRFLRVFPWMPGSDLEPGNDYRIMVYHTDNPQILDISDAFEIR